ncbi:MAG: septum formation initiator family protein [Pseudomonadota bacterium]
MRATIGLIVVVILALQYSLWFGQSGHFAQARLQHKVDAGEQQVAQISERNRVLLAEIMALKADNQALEARARNQLGMIKRGEVFYLVPAPEGP